MIKKIDKVEIFHLFLGAIKAKNEEVKISNDGLISGDFKYIASTNKIVQKFKRVILDGCVYVNRIAYKTYNVIEDMGVIKAIDEQGNKILVLHSDKNILRIGDLLPATKRKFTKQRLLLEVA